MPSIIAFETVLQFLTVTFVASAVLIALASSFCLIVIEIIETEY